MMVYTEEGLQEEACRDEPGSRSRDYLAFAHDSFNEHLHAGQQLCHLLQLEVVLNNLLRPARPGLALLSVKARFACQCLCC